LPTILVAYDIVSEAQRATLSAELKILADGRGWWHHLTSTWLLKTEHSVEVVRDHLAEKLEASDRLIVVDVTFSGRAWSGFNEHAGKWLRERW